jgi:hypothetical protein
MQLPSHERESEPLDTHYSPDTCTPPYLSFSCVKKERSFLKVTSQKEEGGSPTHSNKQLNIQADQKKTPEARPSFCQYKTAVINVFRYRHPATRHQ